MSLQQDRIDLARETAFSLGAIQVHPSTREIRIGDEREVLEPRIMQVLVALARRRGEVVSRTELTESCWDGRVVGDDAISRCITAVRRLSETHGGFALETIPRVGYRLTVKDQNQQPSPAEQTRAFGDIWVRRGLIAAGLFVVGAVIALAVWVLEPRTAPDRSVTLGSPGRLTIAVLPFTPLYSDPNGQKLGDAVALRVADALTRSAFDVISPARSLSFRGAAKAAAAQALHADFLIDGDLHREGEMVIASVRIIEASTGTVTGAGTIERPVAEAARLPGDLAMQMTALGTASRGYSHANGWNARVMAGYIRASYQSISDPYGAYETARAVANAAPNDAFAQTLYASKAAYLVSALLPARRSAMVAEARQATRKAIALDPGSSEPYAVLALTTPLFDWSLREQYLRHGLAIYPDSHAVNIVLIEQLQNAGYFAGSVPLSEALFKANVVQSRNLIEIINAKLWTGQIATARTLIAQGRVLDPRTPWFIAKMFEASAFYGAFAEADVLLHDSTVKAVLEPDGSLKVFGDIATALRHRQQAEIAAVVQDCAQPQGRSMDVRRICFMALAALGRLDDDFKLADFLYPDQRGATPEARERQWLATDVAGTAYLTVPVTAPLRRDPRYRDVVERLGLLQYWKANGHPPDFCATEPAPVCRMLSP